MTNASLSTLNRTLPWAIFLGTSWTWCIGMFLPVLLLRDVGIAGFLVFAIPNIIGAAAMGWVLRDAGHSRQMVRDHEHACVWFSLITILFHAFFAAWIIRHVTGRTAGLWVAGVFFVMWMIFRGVRNGALWAAGTTYLISLAAMAWGLTHDLLPNVATPSPGKMMDAVWLAPVCIFGFVLCPYLDLTFHQARQNLSRASARAAFAIGFGLIFAVMLAFTYCYSGWFASGFPSRAQSALKFILGTHLIVQLCFTVAAHAQQLTPASRKLGIKEFLIFSVAFVVVVLLGTLDHRTDIFYRGLSPGELIYRCFLVFYGLVFPAYAWLWIVPGRVINIRWLAIIFVAVPMYWMGFIEHQMIWLVPGVLIPLLGRFAFAKATYPRNPPASNALPQP